MADPPTNAEIEIKALLESHMAASQSARAEAAAQAAAIHEQLESLRESFREQGAKIVAQGAKILEIDRRMSLSEREIHRMKEDHDMLRGNVMVDLGKLASNDDRQNAKLDELTRNDASQNAKLDDIERETLDQTQTLKELSKSDIVRKAREDTIYWAVTKGMPMLVSALLLVGGAIVWVATHWK